jgi:2-keto-4-pentenoate hydratase
MTHRFRSAALALYLVITPGVAQDGSVDGWVDVLKLQLARGEPLPVLSEYIPDFDLPLASQIQRALTGATGREIGGYKAAFSAAIGERTLDFERPATSVLFADQRHRDGPIVKRTDADQLLLDVAIGFELRSPIRRPMNSVSDLMTYIAHALPVIVLSSSDFAASERPRALDLVATNFGSGAWIVGAPLTLAELGDAATLGVKLFRNGEPQPLTEFRKHSGDYFERLRVFANQLQVSGWPLEAGHILIVQELAHTQASLGSRYRAEFGARASLEFAAVDARGGTPLRP